MQSLLKLNRFDPAFRLVSRGGRFWHDGSTSAAAETSSSPRSVEEWSIGETHGFSASRYRDLSSSSATQTLPGVGGICTDAGHSAGTSPVLVSNQLEGFEGSASVTLRAVTNSNVPEPSSVSVDQQLSSHLDMSGSGRTKLTSSDLQSTLFPGLGTKTINSQTRMHDVTKVFSAWNTRSSSTPVTSGHRHQHYSTAGNPDPIEGTKGVQKSRTEKLKLAVRQYGPTVIVFHVVISLASVGICYVAVASGLDVAALLSKLESTGISTDKLSSKVATGTTTFVVAYAVHKLLMPVRVTITLSCAPLIVRYLRRIGLLKSPPSSSAST